MSIPGKVLWLCLWMAALTGSVKVVVDENPAVRGEPVEMAIEAEGEAVLFPDIRKIGEYNVTREGTQRLERLEENRTVIKWVGYFTFTPKERVTIPSFDLLVDGKVERTSPFVLEVKAPSETLSEEFRLDLLSSRKEVYVGEPVEVTIRFVQRLDVPVMNVDFVPIRYENFWVKQVMSKKEYTERAFRVTERHYLFFPQIPGDLTIGPAQVKIAMAKKIRDAFGNVVRRPKWSTLTSKPLTLHVKPLPQQVRLVGRFQLHTRVEPKRTEAGRPVRLTVRVDAEGNIEDFELPPLRIEGVTVYGEEPTIEQSYRDGVYRGSWEKRYVLVAERSFTVPPITLRYFDPEKGRIERLESAPVPVEIIGGAMAEERKEEPGGEDVPERKEKGVAWIYMNLAVAFLGGMGVMYLFMRWRGREKKGGKKRVTAPGTETQMLQRLMPHISRSREAAQMAENLYASIFEGKAVKVDKKAFEALMRRLKES